MASKLNVIMGSTRPGRAGTAVGQWALEQAVGDGAFDVEYVDLAAFDLPLLDERNHPWLQRYEHEHTKRWSKADVIILGCTELPLVMTEAGCRTALVDTTRLLTRAAFDAAISDVA